MQVVGKIKDLYHRKSDYIPLRLNLVIVLCYSQQQDVQKYDSKEEGSSFIVHIYDPI